MSPLHCRSSVATMILLGFLLLLLSAHSLGAEDDVKDDKKPYLMPEMERLTKILGPGLVKYPEFYADFHTESARLNITVQNYAKTCFDLFFEMKLSPRESGVSGRDFDELIDFMLDNNITYKLPDNWHELAPLVHFIISTRRDAILKAAVKASESETAKFVQYLDDLLMSQFASEVAHHVRGRRARRRRIYEKVALRYKSLSDKVKADLEKSLCARNIIKWTRAMHQQTPIFYGEYAHSFPGDRDLVEIFTETLGLNIDSLLLNNEYLSHLLVPDIKKKFAERAEKINMVPQEYVNICAETIAVMNLPSDAKGDFDLTSPDVMGDRWGKTLLNSTQELGEILEATPIIVLAKRRWNFINGKIHHLTPATRAFLENVNIDHRKALLATNNQLANNEEGVRFPKLFSNETLAQLESNRGILRELEQVYCLQSVLESVFEKNIDFENLNSLRDL